jgi:hypothetical protein
MSKGLMFWIFSAVVIFLLSMVWTFNKFHRQNPAFTAWLYLGVLIQLVGAWWLAGGRPAWVLALRGVLDALTYALCFVALGLAVLGWRAPVNRTVAMGLAGILGLGLLAKGFRIQEPGLSAWLRNLASAGPGVWMLAVFSGARFDRLPLWVKESRIQDLGFRIQHAATALNSALRILNS